MAYVIRGGRAYEYRSIRRGGRVTSEYVGGGSISAESVEFLHRLEAGRRAERAEARKGWEEERTRLDEAERRSIEVDAAYDELATVALLATGHHRPQRGQWRRRRAMRTGIKQAGSTPIIGEAGMNDLLDRIEKTEGDEKSALQLEAHDHKVELLRLSKAGDDRAVPALRVLLTRRPQVFGDLRIGSFSVKAIGSGAASGDAFLTDIFRREIERTASELAGPVPTPLESLLAERVALAWFEAHETDCRYFGATSTEGCPIARAEYLGRQRDRANQRFHAACRSLAAVQRLAVPILCVSVPGAANSHPEAREVSGRRLDSLTARSD